MSESDRPRPVAPTWHTVLVLALLATGVWLGVYLRMASANARLPHLALYTLLIVLEWSVGFGVTLWHSNPAFVAFVAQVLRDPRSLGKDVLTAVAIVGGIFIVSLIIIRFLGTAGLTSLRGMLPRKGLETAVFMLTAVSAGICEEIVFRGYLQQQITAWTGRSTVGIIGQAILFGIGHVYQGWENAMVIGAWGLVFGVAAWMRRGLRGNMIAHAALDIISGLSGSR